MTAILCPRRKDKTAENRRLQANGKGKEHLFPGNLLLQLSRFYVKRSSLVYNNLLKNPVNLFNNTVTFSSFKLCKK